MRHSPGLKTRPTYDRSKVPRNCLDYFLDVPLPVLLPNITGRHERVVLAEDQVFAIDRLTDELLLERKGLHRKQVEPEDPRVVHVRRRRNEVGREHGGLPTGLDEHDLMVRGVAAGPHHADAGPDFLIAVVERDDAGGRERYEIVGHVARSIPSVRVSGVVPG